LKQIEDTHDKNNGETGILETIHPSLPHPNPTTAMEKRTPHRCRENLLVLWKNRTFSNCLSSSTTKS